MTSRTNAPLPALWRAIVAFPCALLLWWLAGPLYSDFLRHAARTTLPAFVGALDLVGASDRPTPVLAAALMGLPLASFHVNAIVVAALAATVPVQSWRRRLPPFAAGCVALAASHLLAVLFTLDWHLVLATSRGAAIAPPSGRVAASAFGYWVFCRLAPLAMPLVIWAAVLRLPATDEPPVAT